MHAQARRFENGAQISDRRTLAVGAGNVNDRRQPPFGMIELPKQPMHPRQIEIDRLRVQRGEPRNQFAERRRRLCRRRVHAGVAAGAVSAPDAAGAGNAIVDEGFATVSIAGDLLKSRHSRASVERNS